MSHAVKLITLQLSRTVRKVHSLNYRCELYIEWISSGDTNNTFSQDDELA